MFLFLYVLVGIIISFILFILGLPGVFGQLPTKHLLLIILVYPIIIFMIIMIFIDHKLRKNKNNKIFDIVIFLKSME